MATIQAGVGHVAANSYETVAEFLEYLTTKPGAVAPSSPEAIALLIAGTRLLEGALGAAPDLDLARAQGRVVAYGWTGEPTTETQALAWPRIGMFTRTGVEIADDVIPQGLKDALSEIAYALKTLNLSATDVVAAQGISSVKAGSVAVSFSGSAALQAAPRVLPDAAYWNLVPSWYLWVVAEGVNASGFEFEVT